MASTTQYLNLKLLGTSEHDKQTYFENWRQDINGETGESNMDLIDAAFHRIDAAVSDIITEAAIDAMFEEGNNGAGE